MLKRISAVNWHVVHGYRLAHRLHKKGWFELAEFVSALTRIFTGAEISPAANIGKGFRVSHGAGIVIGGGVRIGRNCEIYQGVTIGVSRSTQVIPEKRSHHRYPTLGNEVIVYAGAVICGDIEIQDNVEIGANSVVTRDVSAGSIVAGNPAKIVRVKDVSTVENSKIS